MTVTRTIVERCGVPIVRVDAGRRVVYGEVMLPAPELVDGQRVAAADLVGRIHYDGGHMTAPEIVRLLDAFARQNCPVDVQHDKKPRGVTVVESFRAYAGDAPWTPDSWVVAAQVHEDDLWADVENGVLTAFSIQFVVNVTRLRVTVVGDDGTERDVELFRFSEAKPQFLSLVNIPATGATWKIKERSVRPLAGAVVDRTWDADAARQRVEAWAEADDGRRVADAYLTYDGTGGGHLVADVEDGRLVVVRQALSGVAPDGLDDDDRARLGGVLSLTRAVVPFQDLPLADEDTTWDSGAARARVKEWAGGDDWKPAKFRRAFTWYDAEEADLLGSYKLGVGDIVDDTLKAVPRAVFAAAGRIDQTAISDDDKTGVQAHLGKYYDKMDRTPPWAEERSMGDETKPEDVERDVEAAEEVTPEPEAAPESEPESAPEEGKTEEPAGEVEAEPAEEPAAETEVAPEEAPAEEPAAEVEADVEPAAEPVEEDTPTLDPGSLEDATITPVHYAVIDGAPVVAPDDYEGPTYTVDQAGGFVEVETEPEPDVERAGFAAKIAVQAMDDMLWAGSSALHQTIREIMASEDVAGADKIGSVQGAIAEFATWGIDKVGSLGAATFAPADSPLAFGRCEHIERAGKKMAKARLKKLKAAVQALAALIAELDTPDEDVKRSEPETPANDLAAQIAKLTKTVETIARTRTASSQVGTEPAPEEQRTPEAIVADVLRGK